MEIRVELCNDNANIVYAVHYMQCTVYSALFNIHCIPYVV